MSEQAGATDITEPPWPRPLASWGMVALLSVTYISSFIDRYVFGLLASQIKADLALTDTQIGLLGGLAFAIFYATSGLFLGWLADHKSRTWIVGIGSLVWSIATTCSGLAGNYWQLFLARMGVGAGEATLSPCAMGIIGDSFPPERRGTPIAVYTSALVIGAGLASLLSAAIIGWTMTTPLISVPVFGEVKPWQLTFLIVGLPGILMALPFFFLKDPPRRRTSQNRDLTGAHLSDTLRYVGRHWAVFFGLFAIVCVMTITAYTQATWMPSTFERTYGWSPAQYSLINGILILSVSPLTIITTGRLSDRLTARGVVDAPMLLLSIGLLIVVPTNILATLMPSGVLAFAVLAVNIIGVGMISSVGVTALLPITPDRIRSQVVAVYYMVISMTGLLIGPVGAGLLSDYVFGPDNLRYALPLLFFLTGIIPIVLLGAIRRNYRAELARLRGLQT